MSFGSSSNMSIDPSIEQISSTQKNAEGMDTKNDNSKPENLKDNIGNDNSSTSNSDEKNDEHNNNNNNNNNNSNTSHSPLSPHIDRQQSLFANQKKQQDVTSSIDSRLASDNNSDFQNKKQVEANLRDNGTEGTEKNSNEGSDPNKTVQGLDLDKAGSSNVNTTMLEFGDDYTNMLSNLHYGSHDHKHQKNSNFSAGDTKNENNTNAKSTSNHMHENFSEQRHVTDKENGNLEQGVEENNLNNERKSSEDSSKNENLDMLIQHYEGLIKKHNDQATTGSNQQDKSWNNDTNENNGNVKSSERKQNGQLISPDSNASGSAIGKNDKSTDLHKSDQKDGNATSQQSTAMQQASSRSPNTNVQNADIYSPNAVNAKGSPENNTPRSNNFFNTTTQAQSPNSLFSAASPMVINPVDSDMKFETPRDASSTINDNAGTRNSSSKSTKGGKKPRKTNTPTSAKAKLNNTKQANKSSTSSNASSNNGYSTVINQDRKICDHCRRRQTQCVQVPNLQNCIQCESKGIKCTYSELASTKNSSEIEQLKRSRVDENVNVHDLLKRAKLDPSMSNNNGTTLAKWWNECLPRSKCKQLNAISGMQNSLNKQDASGNQSLYSNNNTGAFSYIPKTSNMASPNDNTTSVSTPKQQQQQQQQQQLPNQNMFPHGSPHIQSPASLPPHMIPQQQQMPLPQIHDLQQMTANAFIPGVSGPGSQFNRSNGPNNVAPSYPRSSFYVGPTSLFDYNLINHVKLDKIDQIQISPSLTLRKVAPNVQFVLRDDFNEKLYLKQEQEIDLVEKLIHPHGKMLVDIFFKVIHPYYPILHERVFMEKYSRSYRELTAPLLASIYSLALQWWDHHPQLVGFMKPDVTEQLNELALRTFFDVVERPKLSIVQAGLLILMCRSESSNNWVIISEVVALAEELGLGIDCQDWRLPRWERGLRRRLAWAVWSMDKWISASEGRYSHLILGRNWLVKMLSDEDFPEDPNNILSGSSISGSSSPAANFVPYAKNNKTPNGTSNLTESLQTNNVSSFMESHTPVQNPGSPANFIMDIQPTPNDIRGGRLLFQQFVSLSIILGEILDTFYTLGAMSITTKVDYVLKLAKPLQLKLREWYHSLPAQLSMNYLQPRRLNSNASLTLAYFAAEITLHRKIISTLDTSTPADLTHVCRQAAKTRLSAAIDFICDLKVEHTNSFWYSCSSNNMALIGSFAALLYCTSSTTNEKELYRNYLRKYIITLRISAKSFEKTRAALEFSQLLDEILL
ncbi:hypothetical protein ACO0QE_004788 [Hanseniaspora vineae]